MSNRRRCLIVLLGLVAAVPAQAQRVQVNEKLEDLQTRAIRDSNDPAAHYNLAMGYWSKKRYADAEASLRTATQIDPQFADAYLALSVVRNWDDDYWSQIRKVQGDSGIRGAQRLRDSYYRKAFMLDPLVDVKILGATYRIYSQSRFAGAFRDLVEGRYDKAYETVDKEMKFWGGRAGTDSAPEIVVWMHGLSAAHTSQYPVAIHDMENLMSRVRHRADVDSSAEIPLLSNEFRYMTAALRQKAGDMDQAVGLYLEVAQNDAGHYMAHVQLARLYESQRDYPRAVQERLNATNANPDDPSLLLDLGITLGKAGMMPQAETRLRLANEGNPRDVRALYWLGVAQMEEGKNAEAKESLTRFLALAPSRFDRQIAMARDRLAQLPQETR